nr:mitochondrial proton/calcium exchanger protein-like [Tanacetum cinerariifolium]
MSYRSCVQGLSNVAEEVGATIGLKHKKINVSISRVNDNTTLSSVPTLENNLAGDFSPVGKNEMKQQEKIKRRLNARIKYAKVRSVANDEILGFAKLFNDQLTLRYISRATLFSLPVDTVGVTSLPFKDSISKRQRKLDLAVLTSVSSLSREREEFLKLVNKEINTSKLVH